jgi:hypothetical protein
MILDFVVLVVIRKFFTVTGPSGFVPLMIRGVDHQTISRFPAIVKDM